MGETYQARWNMWSVREICESCEVIICHEYFQASTVYHKVLIFINRFWFSMKLIFRVLNGDQIPKWILIFADINFREINFCVDVFSRMQFFHIFRGFIFVDGKISCWLIFTVARSVMFMRSIIIAGKFLQNYQRCTY